MDTKTPEIVVIAKNYLRRVQKANLFIHKIEHLVDANELESLRKVQIIIYDQDSPNTSKCFSDLMNYGLYPNEPTVNGLPLTQGPDFKNCIVPLRDSVCEAVADLAYLKVIEELTLIL
jgi:hypothetical protein